MDHAHLMRKIEKRLKNDVAIVQRKCCTERVKNAMLDTFDGASNRKLHRYCSFLLPQLEWNDYRPLDIFLNSFDANKKLLARETIRNVLVDICTHYTGEYTIDPIIDMDDLSITARVFCVPLQVRMSLIDDGDFDYDV